MVAGRVLLMSSTQIWPGAIGKSVPPSSQCVGEAAVGRDQVTFQACPSRSTRAFPVPTVVDIGV